MNISLVLLFLFSVGCMGGWVIEVLFRKFFSAANPEHRWVNPGFLTGPYLPLYGFGLVLLFLIACQEPFMPSLSPAGRKALLFTGMAICMTGIEYLAGYLCLRFAHVRLWDYSHLWGNFQGLICPLFSFFWAILGALYYFLIHPYIRDALVWLSNNLAFSFFIGFFYGIFIIDLVNATNILVIIRRVAMEKQVVIKYDELRNHIRSYKESRMMRARFMFSMHSDLPLVSQVNSFLEWSEKSRSSMKERAGELADEIRNHKKHSRQ